MCWPALNSKFCIHGDLSFTNLFFLPVLFVTCQEDPLDKLRSALPGEPGVDYPILSSIQNTEFNCEGKTFGGFYAEPDTDCQGYHVCLQVRGWLDITYYQGYYVCLQVRGWWTLKTVRGIMSV